MSTGNLTLARKAIAALHTLRTHQAGAPLTAEQVATLKAWPGWGPLAPAFDSSSTPAWVKIRAELDALFHGRGKELTKAAENVDNAFFTPEPLVRHMWALLVKAGFSRGAVLEPGCGSGRFLSYAPSDIDIDFTGVEVDRTSAAIASALHPEARIIGRSFEKVFFPEGSFDAVIGNVPFSSANVYDGQVSMPLHTYFLHRALDAVRPGGYIVVVTSRFQLDNDGSNSLARLTRGRAELVTAVRLPSGYLEGTDVVADVLVMRKPSRGETATQIPTATRSLDSDKGWRNLSVSQFWFDNPGLVAGTLAPSGHYRNPITVTSSSHGRDVAAAFSAATTMLVPFADRVPCADELFGDVALTDAQGRPEGRYVIEDGAVRQVCGGVLADVKSAGKELRALIELRDEAEALLAADCNAAVPDSQVTVLRDAVRRSWQTYVATYGPLNRGQLVSSGIDPDSGEERLSWRQPRLGGFRADPGFVTVMALESFDSSTGEAAPAEILLHRVNTHAAAAVSADTAAEALAISLGEGRGVDLDRIADLLAVSHDQAVSLLGDLVYESPQQPGRYETARDYLSGNIRSKLSIARAAAAHDPRWERNAAALERVLPPQVGELDIEVRLGAPWMTSEDIEEFALEVLGGRASVTHVPAVAAWTVEYCYSSAEARLEYGTAEMSPGDLLAVGLNGRSATVYDTTAEGKRVRNNDATLAAEEKLAALQQRFAVWVWEDTERATRIIDEYNRRYRSHVPRTPDGSYLTFPSMAGGIELWPWQKNMVDQILSSPRSLCGHAVGAGKTLTMAATAVTLRRLGIVRKPLITVPNHLLVQISREMRQAFPTGRFLIAEKGDLHASKRRLFAARCATGEWDAVVMTHEAFSSIPVGEDAEADFLEEEKSRLRTAMSSISTGRGSKELARAMRSLENRLAQLRSGVADTEQVLFAHLGVDFLAVDECHKFKRLPIATRADGFSLGASKRATDLAMKIELLGRKAGNRPHVALFTGTPWTNTLAETYVWQRYLQPQRLRETGVDHFDAWAAAFVSFATRVEVAPDGSGFRMQRRPVGFHNVTEMHRMLAEVADLLPMHEIPQQRPTPVRQTIVCEPGPQVRDYVAGLAERAEKIRSGRVTSDQDNMLAVCGDGRKAALDPALAGLTESSPKLAAAAREAARIYRTHRHRTFGQSVVPGALQLMLCDLGTPKAADASSYGRLKKLLISEGVPAGKVRFIHDARNDTERAALFTACREGAVAVLIGSTSKVGIGTNVQTRLAAIHHVDAPWMPSDIEQREGRAIRTGNLNAEVEILTYVTEHTFDAYMWQALTRKAAFITQLFRSGDSVARTMDDISTTTLSYGEVLALASGNPQLLKRAELSAAIRRLQLERASHIRNVKASFAGAESLAQRAADQRYWIGSAERLRAERVSAPSRAEIASSVTAALSWGTGRVPFGHCRLELSTSTGKPMTATLKYRFAWIADLDVPRKGGATKMAAAIDQWLGGYLTGLDDRIEAAYARAGQLEGEAERTRTAAETAIFGKYEELETLLKQRAELDEQIEEMASGLAPGGRGVEHPDVTFWLLGRIPARMRPSSRFLTTVGHIGCRRSSHNSRGGWSDGLIG